MKLLPILLFATCAIFARGLNLPGYAVRAAEVGDIVGSFSLEGDRSRGRCPSRIVHSAFNQSNNPFVSFVPHGEISQDDVDCNPYSYLTIYNGDVTFQSNIIGDEEADSRSDFQRFIANDTLIPNAGRQLRDQNVDFFILLERQTRICGQTTKFKAGTVGMLVSEDNDIDLEGIGELEGGSKHMVLVDRRDDRVCIYQGSSDEEAATPVNSATPSPMASPGAVAEDGSVIGGGVTGETDGEVGPSESPDAEGEDSDDEDDDDDDDDNDDVCFPADTQVELEDGVFKSMEQLQIGDKVRVSASEFSPVFMFTHKLSDAEYDFVHISTKSGHKLHLTKSHYLYINDKLAAARVAKAGDTLELANGVRTSIVEVSSTKKRGLYNPQTIHGDIITNGVRASTYTTSIEPTLAHRMLSPLRILYRSFGASINFLESGGSRLVKFLPRGANVVV